MTITKHLTTPSLSRRCIALGIAMTAVLSAGACSASSPKKADAKSEIGTTTQPEPSDSSGSTTTSDASGSGVPTYEVAVPERKYSDER